MAYIYNPIQNTFEGTSQNVASLGQVMWHITSKCQLNCAMCFTRRMRMNSEEVANKDIRLYVSLLKKLGVKKIDISGGEPLLYEQLPFLVEECTSNSIAVTITTSGVGLKKNIEWVAKHWYVFSRVIVSIDGPKNIHNELRGNSCAYSCVERFFSSLKLNGCLNLRINTLLTKKCVGAGICDQLSVDILSFQPIEWCVIEPFPINKTELFDELTVGKEEYEAFFDRCTLLMRNSPIRVICRKNEDYGSYWVLFPDGYLYYSHDNCTYDTRILLDEHNIPRICELVKENKQNYINITEERKC